MAKVRIFTIVAGADATFTGADATFTGADATFTGGEAAFCHFEATPTAHSHKRLDGQIRSRAYRKGDPPARGPAARPASRQRGSGPRPGSRALSLNRAESRNSPPRHRR
ncbi:hypothetical protein FE633_36745 [Streptomyces montanus]|uniref:Uncharacterized protein n=1 Tax=Streptomyces montanus TaxID=2580423 RepID=A0A5R9FKL1_9ACTN|nr:hypothetical protein [Streptomyces montanus]TLS41383.1 hypothetical protein FE633_36745 [Streptomyces montanus]